LRIKDLSKELEGSVDRSNRIVERFLVHRVQDKGVLCGQSSAQDIWVWMKRQGIDPVNGRKNTIKWINRQIGDVLLNAPLTDFTIIEVEGQRLGVNFVWWYHETGV
jgi:hypothetical protein